MIYILLELSLKESGKLLYETNCYNLLGKEINLRAQFFSPQNTVL